MAKIPDFEVKVEVINIDKVIAKVKDRDTIRQGIVNAAEYVRRDAQKYPEPRKPKKMKNLTQKQRRAIFWKLKNGKIVIPYQRGTSPDSHNMKRNWRVKIEKSGLQARIYNFTTYAKWVYGGKRQAWYHRNYWPTLHKLVLRQRKEVIAIISRAVGKAIK